MKNFSSRIRLQLLGALATLPLAAAVAAAPSTNDVRVVMDTSLGSIELRLDAARTPVTVRNFLHYVDTRFYDNTVFHRVIDGFMIQGGGFTADMKQKPTAAPIVNEARSGLTNQRGTIAMARTGEPHSATSQFFINTVNNDFLNVQQAQDGWGYCVFGRVTRGMDVVDKIAAVRTHTRGFMSDVPEKTVTIHSVKVIR